MDTTELTLLIYQEIADHTSTHKGVCACGDRLYPWPINRNKMEAAPEVLRLEHVSQRVSVKLKERSII